MSAVATPYRVTDAHAATIARLTADARAAGFAPRISYVPASVDASPGARGRGWDGVHLQIGTGHENGPHREHSVISWCNWTDHVYARPGVPLTLDQVAPYLAAYRERMERDRYGISGDGLDAVYHAVTGRGAYGPQPRPVAVSAPPAPFVSGWSSVLPAQ